MRNSLDSVVVVEPGLHQSLGHMRGELELFLSGLKANHVTFRVVGSRAPASPVPDDWNLVCPPSFWIYLFESLNPRIGVRLVEFLTYALAFTIALQKNCPLIGLTSSGPFGIALAMFCRRKMPKSLLITRHLGPMGHRHLFWAFVFKYLLKKESHLGFYSKSVREHLAKNFPASQSKMFFLPEVASVSIPLTRRRPQSSTILVSGLDSEGRRSPVRHLRLLKNLRFANLILHDPTGRFEGCDALQKKFARDVRIERVSDYFAEEYSAFLSKASVVFVAYDPHFQNPSSVLRHAICAGVPVISSRFPDFQFLEDKFGLLGEAWVYDNPQSLDAALNRFSKWTALKRMKFASASCKVRKWLAPPRVVREHLKVLYPLPDKIR